ncbi:MULTISPECIES: hypothetical protein [unclassified Photobacterium]|uniref:hypothetical protein n=1 Tax=unclassified Photobacterium TaxID=2628852 RepID=UPI001EDE5987|nr:MULTISPECIES: hypothetical protein [unclassified Photobacterium]MCG3862636.1 hypothetical protein [Photobacterium sp. Ph6]MCG3874167.1 hypothetical protein [Photobacterium sp. Ph5]
MDDVNLAFLKLKNHIYYDSSNLKLREEIASFEQSAEFKDKLSLLTKNINKFDINSDYWNELFNGISSFSFLKKISLDKINNYGVISNTTESKNIKTETNEFIRMPIELHICSMIWSIKVGYTLEKKCI